MADELASPHQAEPGPRRRLLAAGIAVEPGQVMVCGREDACLVAEHSRHRDPTGPARLRLVAARDPGGLIVGGAQNHPWVPVSGPELCPRLEDPAGVPRAHHVRQRHPLPPPARHLTKPRPAAHPATTGVVSAPGPRPPCNTLNTSTR